MSWRSAPIQVATRAFCLVMLVVAAVGWTSPGRATSSDPTSAQPQEASNDSETAADGSRSPRSTEAVLTEEITDGDYPFCLDPEYRLHRAERRLCVYAPQMKERCPAFETNCARPASEDWGEYSWGDLWSGESSKEQQKKESEPWELKLPPELAELFMVIFFTLLAVAVILVVVWIARNLVGWSSPEAKLTKQSSEDDVVDSETMKPDRVVETDVQRLLARAKQHAQAGQYASASDDLHAALLRHLDHLGLLHLHTSKTNGDYMRSLRSHPEWRDAVWGSTQVVERSQFGSEEPDSGAFSGLLAKVEPLIVKGASLALALLMSSAAVGCDAIREITDSGEGQWGVLENQQATGYSTLTRMLEAQDMVVRNHTGSIKQLDPEIENLLIHDRTALKPKDWRHLEDWVRSGHYLIIAGDERGAAHFGVEYAEAEGDSTDNDSADNDSADNDSADDADSNTDSDGCDGPLEFGKGYYGFRRKEPPFFGGPPTLKAHGVGPTLTITSMDRREPAARSPDAGSTSASGIATEPAESEQAESEQAATEDATASATAPADAGTFDSYDYGIRDAAYTGPAEIVLECDQGPLVVERQLGDGSVLIVSDGDLLSNASLAARDNALVFTSLLRYPGTRIDLAGGLTGAGAESPYAALRNAGLSLVLLQLALLLVALYWCRGAAFGLLRDPIARARRDFIDHIEAVGRNLARARASRHALSTYFGWASERLQDRARPGTRLTLVELSEAIAKQTGRETGDVMRILTEAHSAKTGDQSAHDPADLRVLQELEALVIETGGTR